MLGIRIHGRGGQGGKKLSKLIAQAAFMEGKEVQSFALYGAERRGAPVVSFVRIDTETIEVRGYVNTPDVIIVLDASLMEMEEVGVINGKPDLGTVIINTKDKYIASNYYTVDATQIALDVIGKPIFNTSILGAFAKSTGIVSLKSACEAIQHDFNSMPQKIIDKNIEACKKAYDMI